MRKARTGSADTKSNRIFMTLGNSANLDDSESYDELEQFQLLIKTQSRSVF